MEISFGATVEGLGLRVLNMQISFEATIEGVGFTV